MPADDPSALHLIFDADDTLWENNILFERTVERFITDLDHPTLSSAEVRAVLDEIERRNILAHGYGSAGFAASLEECYRALAGRTLVDDDVKHIRGYRDALTRDPPELIPGVVETLTELASRHDLLLLTKGQVGEQRRKIELSQLGPRFRSIVIVPEKNAETYRQLVADEALNAEKTWMIGNSPKSDVNPARAAGLGAVLVPNPHTWSLEHEELAFDDDRTVTVERIKDLLDLF